MAGPPRRCGPRVGSQPVTTAAVFLALVAASAFLHPAAATSIIAASDIVACTKDGTVSV
jgi:hypothetical protein